MQTNFGQWHSPSAWCGVREGVNPLTVHTNASLCLVSGYFWPTLPDGWMTSIWIWAASLPLGTSPPGAALHHCRSNWPELSRRAAREWTVKAKCGNQWRHQKQNCNIKFNQLAGKSETADSQLELSVCLSLWLPVYVCLLLPQCLSVSLSVSLTVSLSVSLLVRSVSVSLSVRVVCLYVDHFSLSV